MRCLSCGSIPPRGDEWASCWPCLHCSRYVCNQPVFTKEKGERTSTPCYVKHNAAMHPHVYEKQK